MAVFPVMREAAQTALEAIGAMMEDVGQAWAGTAAAMGEVDWRPVGDGVREGMEASQAVVETQANLMVTNIVDAITSIDWTMLGVNIVQMITVGLEQFFQHLASRCV